MIDMLLTRLLALFELGGPVVMVLIGMSVITVALALVKLWQFHAAGVGQHAPLRTALAEIDSGRAASAAESVAAASSHLAALLVSASRSVGVQRADADAVRARLTGMAEASLAQLQSGFRILDSIAQLAPLLGLFGTVLGMISAFQALQASGAAVDPSALAGGIWVALLTTAVGLGVAMPTTLILTWLESRVAGESRMAMQIIDVTLCAGMQTAATTPDDV